MKFILISFLFFLFFLANNLWASGPSEVLFIFYDAGETLALRPVAENLQKKHIGVKALIMGTARTILSGCSYCLDIQKDCGTEEFVDHQKWMREQLLKESDLLKIQNCVQSKVIITGDASEAQKQIIKLFKSSPSIRIGYHDSFAISKDDLTQQFLHETDEFWVPHEILAQELRKSSPTLKIMSMGHPTVESWALSSQREDPKNIIKQLPGFDSHKKTILYAGGYGDNYEKALTMFFEAIEGHPEYQYLLSPHPKVDGTVEKKIWGIFPKIKLIFVPKSVGTRRAAIVSHLLVSKSSSVGIQALFMNKPTIYLDVPGSSYTDIAIQEGWAPQVFTKNEFTAKINDIFNRRDQNKKNIYSKIKMPKNSTEKMVGRIQELLVKKFKKEKKF